MQSVALTDSVQQDDEYVLVQLELCMTKRKTASTTTIMTMTVAHTITAMMLSHLLW